MRPYYFASVIVLGANLASKLWIMLAIPPVDLLIHLPQGHLN